MKWKVIAYGDGFAVQTPDPSPEATDIYNVPGPIICRQDKAGIYGTELTEKEAHLIAAAPEMRTFIEDKAGYNCFREGQDQPKCDGKSACISCQARAIIAKVKGRKS